MIAPLAGWWPWASGRLRLPVALLLVMIIVSVVALSHVAKARTAHASRSSGRRPYAGLATNSNKPTGSLGPSTVSYKGIRYTVEMPAGWYSIQNERETAGEIESTWADSLESKDEILIDVRPATDLTLQETVAPVRTTLKEVPGYREIQSSEGDLKGRPSWMLLYDINGRERIDYFFTQCSTAFAVLGSSPVDRFSRLSPIFRGIAESVQMNCAAAR